MLRLILLRHAKSDWSSGGLSDHERPLNPRGRAAAPIVGRYLADNQLIPTRILCSTATRTRETCALVVAAFPQPPDIHYESRIYEAEPGNIIKVIAATPDDVHTLLVIGHNPGLQMIALALAEQGSPKQLARLREKFPTAALAVIDFPVRSWGVISAGGGTLERFVIPRDIDEDD